MMFPIVEVRRHGRIIGSAHIKMLRDKKEMDEDAFEMAVRIVRKNSHYAKGRYYYRIRKTPGTYPRWKMFTIL